MLEAKNMRPIKSGSRVHPLFLAGVLLTRCTFFGPVSLALNSPPPRLPAPPPPQKPHKTNEDWCLAVRARLRHATTKEITVGN